MARMSFTEGTRLSLKGEWFIIRDTLVGQKVLLESISCGGKTIHSVDELVKAFFEGNLWFEVLGRHVDLDDDSLIPVNYALEDFSILPEEVRAEAWRRYQIIRPLLDIPPHERTRKKIEEYVQQLRKEQGLDTLSQPDESSSPRQGVCRGQALSRTSVEQWLRYYIESNQDLRSLADEMYKCGAPGTKRLDKEKETIIDRVLSKCEKKKKRRFKTVKAVWLEVVNETAKENRKRPIELRLKPPSMSTVYNRIRERGVANIIRRRKSRREEQAEGPVQPGPEVTRIMECVEFDDTPLPLIVVDEVDRLPIGRPTVGAALDKYSEFPVGLHVSFEPPSYNTTMACALHCISPKPDVCTLYGTQHQWNACGLPELAKIDNGPAYRNRHMLIAFATLGILVEQCPVYAPWFKPRVERFFRTNNTGLIHPLPGSTLENVLARGDYDPMKDACISKTAFMEMLHIFLLDMYAQEFHTGIQDIPARRWAQSEQDGYVPCLPANLDELRVLLYRTEERTLQRIGIEYESIVYQGSDLSRLRRLLKAEDRKVTIKVNPDDISYIYVLDPLTEKDYLRFDANDDTGYTQGRSLWQHRYVRRHALEIKGQVDIESLAEAWVNLQQIVEKEYLATRRVKRRTNAKRLLDTKGDSESPPDRVTSEGITLVPPLSERVLSKENAPEPQEPTDEDKPKDDKPSKPSESDSEPKHMVPKSSEAPPPAQDPSTTDQNDVSDENGWSSDYHLPPRGRDNPGGLENGQSS